MTDENHLQVLRYLRALDTMTRDSELDCRVFARKILRDLGEPACNMFDYLRPFMELPVGQLSDLERRLRFLASNPGLTLVHRTAA